MIEGKVDLPSEDRETGLDSAKKDNPAKLREDATESLVRINNDPAMKELQKLYKEAKSDTEREELTNQMIERLLLISSLT